MNWDLHRVTLFGVILLLIPPVFFAEGSRTIPRLFTLMGLFAILVMALNIVFGHTDQLLLFAGAMTATGAYTTVMLAEYLGVSPWMTILVGALLAGAIGVVVTYVAARRGLGIIVIAILTLALQFSFIELINRFREYTGGATGLRLNDLTITPIEELPLLNDDYVLFYMIGALLLALMYLYYYLMNSKYGLAFEMIRQDQDAAASIGVNVVKYKVLAAFIATFAMGLAGPLFGQRSGFLTPNTFAFANVDVLILIMLIVGGMRTMYGPIVGTVIILLIDDYLRDFGAFRSMLFGILLIILFLYFRRGVVRWARDLADEYGLVRRSRELLPGTGG